jgi:predicted transcriptional regulator
MSERKNNRGKIEIMSDILNLSTSGIKKTHIMYRANLSYEQILFYLNELLAKGLIRQDVTDGSLIYRTTEKGREFLGCYLHMARLLSEAEGEYEVEESDTTAPLISA